MEILEQLKGSTIFSYSKVVGQRPVHPGMSNGLPLLSEAFGGDFGDVPAPFTDRLRPIARCSRCV